MINVPSSIAVLLTYVFIRGFLNRDLLRIEAKSDNITNIFTYTGFVSRDGSRLNNNDVNVLVPSTTVEVWSRRANRSFNETPLGDVKFTRQYNLPCAILTLSEFLEGRNNLLQSLITTLNLTQLDWQNFVNDLIDTITSKNPDNTFVYTNSDRSLAITRLTNLINDSRTYQYGRYIPIPGSFYGGVLSGAWTDQAVAQRIQDELPKALFKQCQAEFIIPLVCQVYPNPVLIDPDTGSPTCEDGYMGVCCLYDTVVEIIRPGLERNVKIYKECLQDIDKADCFNRTKTFSQSSTDATQGQYDGAEFYSLDERAADGCETCKNPVSIVFCSDNVSFIYKNKSLVEIKTILNNAFEPTNIQYFNNANKAQEEHNRRLNNLLCGYFQQELEQPPPPSIEPGNCDNDTISVLVSPPTGCNIDIDDKINYHFYIDGILRHPQSIVWTPGPSNSIDSSVTAVFDKKFENDSIFVRASFVQTDNATGSILSGPESVNSNTIQIDCTPTPTPTPEPEPGFPVSVILNNFIGGSENCSNYNGTYIVYQPFIDGNPAEYNYSVDPPNNYATDAAVKVGYYSNSGDIYVCLYIATPEGDTQLCQSYDIDWNTGNYVVAWGGGFPSTPWCTGDINLDINI